MTTAELETKDTTEEKATARFRELGRTFLAANRPSEAQAALRRALVLAPRDAATVVNLATLRPLAAAVASEMRRGIILAPVHLGVLANLAAAHAAAADCPNALATWRRLLLVFPACSRATLGLAQMWIAGPDRHRKWHGDMNRGTDWLCRSVLLDPKSLVPADLLDHLARAVKAAGAHHRATRLLRAALAQLPSNAERYGRLGIWLCNNRSWPQALLPLSRYLILNPSGLLAARVLELLGHVYGNGREHQKAYLQFLRVLTLNPSRFQALLPHLANAALASPLTTKTEHLVRVALVCHPSDPVIYQNFGGVISAAGQMDASSRAIRRATMIDPQIDVSVSLGTHMLRKGRPFAAWAYFEAAVAARPDNPEAFFNCCKMRLALGDDAGGIDAVRARWRISSFQAPYELHPVPTLPLPVWQDQPIAGKRFFVWGEQGIGDDIWFAGRLNDFVSAGAEVVFECSPKIAGLMARSFPDVEVWARGQTEPDCSVFDYQLPIGHLTQAFHQPGAVYPSGYLRVDNQLARQLRDCYTDHGAKPAVGIAWRTIKPAAHGSFEAPIMDWGPLLCQREFNFVSLQYGNIGPDIAAAADAFGVKIYQDPRVNYDGDLQAAAAQIAAVDAVVSIASAPVILAHGLGRKTWAVLRRSQEDWRYKISARRSLWLPHCRTFWPQSAENWREVLTAVSRDMRQILRESLR